ncbi:MAG: hypothetical protein CM1200mP2_09890 [Planctomycetaceae bacterium]|nr:MAG: hypothetical protein CM1200mP2_09890 [Planctomycetaceae bacterium]
MTSLGIRLQKRIREGLGRVNPLHPAPPTAKQGDHQPGRVKDPWSPNDPRTTQIRRGPIGNQQPAPLVGHQQIPGIEISVQSDLVILGDRHTGHAPALNSPGRRQRLAPVHRQSQRIMNCRQCPAGTCGHLATVATTAANQPGPQWHHPTNPFEDNLSRLGPSTDDLGHIEQAGPAGNRTRPPGASRLQSPTPPAVDA